MTKSSKKRANALELEGNSLGCFAPDNCLRLFLAEFVQNPYFEQFILHLIGLNSLFMALEEPVLTDKYALATLKIIGDVVSVLFIFECVLKIFVMGFVRGKKTYLHDSFNLLDFVIVVISIVIGVLPLLNTCPSQPWNLGRTLFHKSPPVHGDRCTTPQTPDS